MSFRSDIANSGDEMLQSIKNDISCESFQSILKESSVDSFKSVLESPTTKPSELEFQENVVRVTRRKAYSTKL